MTGNQEIKIHPPEMNIKHFTKIIEKLKFEYFDILILYLCRGKTSKLQCSMFRKKEHYLQFNPETVSAVLGHFRPTRTFISPIQNTKLKILKGIVNPFKMIEAIRIISEYDSSMTKVQNLKLRNFVHYSGISEFEQYACNSFVYALEMLFKLLQELH